MSICKDHFGKWACKKNSLPKTVFSPLQSSSHFNCTKLFRFFSKMLVKRTESEISGTISYFNCSLLCNSYQGYSNFLNQKKTCITYWSESELWIQIHQDKYLKGTKTPKEFNQGTPKHYLLGYKTLTILRSFIVFKHKK